MKVFEKVKEVFEKERKLIEIKEAKKVIFVGDTHGDLEASKKVIKDYLPTRRSLVTDAPEPLWQGYAEDGKRGNKIVFLGDYVDRGPKSRENLVFLLEVKEKNPDQIFLLQGNHEGHRISKFSPADFWESLNKEEYKKYCSLVEKFPLVVITKNIIALHGALPEVKNLKEINEIKLGGEQWMQITWGDFTDRSGRFLGVRPFTDRPEFGRDYFFELMKRFDKKVLIRAHDPTAPQFLFNDRCLTIFTSSAYTGERTIAIVDLSKKIKTAKDLEIIRI